jgi:hypothetical protein
LHETAQQVQNEDRPKRMTLALGDLHLTFPSSVYLDTSWTLRTTGDTVSITLDLGETIEDSLFTLSKPNGYAVQVFHRYQTSVVIEDEGPHWDLTAFKHYDSEWHEIALTDRDSRGSLVFNGPNYSQADWDRKPSYTNTELFDFLNSRKMGDLAVRLASPKKDEFIRANSSISSIFFKLLVTRPNGSQYIRYVEFEIPMGC